MRYRHILRRLLRAPGFTAIAVVTLALGIGANSAIFSVIEGVLLKPLPYPHAEQLIGVWYTAPGVNLPLVNIAPSLYFTDREGNRSFTDIGVWNDGTASVTGLAEPEEAECVWVTDGTLPLLGIRPALGRWFSRQDDSPGSPETAMLMYGYWQTRFGGAASVIGRTILVDGKLKQIIGVMPRDFQFLDRKPALLLPFQFDRAKAFLGNFSDQGIARLKPGVSMAQASTDMARLLPVYLASFPAPPGYNKKMFAEARLAPNLRPLTEDVVGNIGGTLWVLMGTIGMVLLIACANVANLLLVRAEGRQHELAIRAALGAGWGEIARELLWESLTLGMAGGVAGLGVAYGALQLLRWLAPANLPRLDQISIDGTVLGFTLAVSLAAGLLFGAIPVIKYAGPHLSAALRGGGRNSSQSRERHRTRSVLVVVQVALALVLLISSGLMIRSFQALRNVQPGFNDPGHIQTLRISIPTAQVHDDPAVFRMQQDILDRLTAIPGVSAAGLATIIPMDGNGWTDPVYAEDHTYSEGRLPALRHYRFISPGLLTAMGNRLVTGRDFTWTDLAEKRPFVLVSENMARELWGAPQAAIGKRVRSSGREIWREVIGVVGDEYDQGVDQKPWSTIYWPILMGNFDGNENFVCRSVAIAIRSNRTGTEGFLNDVQRAIWSVNPNLPLANVRTMRQLYDKSLARTSFTLVMLAIAGAMALLLGMVGIYGVISYSVAQRTREIGIRMALGAQRGELTGLFLRHGLRLALIGVACGLAAAAGLMQFLAKLLFGVKPVDPLTYAAVSGCLIAAALAASYLPALRSTAIDPVNALRAE
ncbi:MAG TPA: ABC transporter permease [Bryobacteraceae bacterium]|nr:ABC transporter permease [Bryobacteraceae bacterium]